MVRSKTAMGRSDHPSGCIRTGQMIDLASNIDGASLTLGLQQVFRCHVG
jgi:hypothetical protein